MEHTCFLVVFLMQCSLFRSQYMDKAWDHFVIAQQWPMTVCIDAKMSQTHTCRISKNITTWTMHGVWPSLGTTMGPVNCNFSDPSSNFNPDLLSPILPQLGQFWPNLYADSEFYSFWKHEWCKHGTCAKSLPTVSNELKYFQKGLELRQKFDLLGILRKAGIVPSDDNTYQYDEFYSALSKGLNYVKPMLSCVYDRETKTQYIIQVEFCISQTFSIIDCPKKTPHNSEALKFNLYDTSKSERMLEMKRKKRDPEACTEKITARNLHNPSPCRDTEDIAYPVIKYV